MTALWVFLLIVAWLLIGVAFARHFRVALVELADMKQPGVGWLFILGWPVYGLALLWMEAVIRLVDFAAFGDHLANVARTEAEMADGLEKIARAFDDFAQVASSFGETAKAKEEVPHGEW